MGNILLFYGVIFGANIIQAVCAFGGSLLSMPFGIILLGAPKAKAIMSVVTVIGCVIPAARHYKHIDWLEAGKIIAVMLFGTLAAQAMPEDPPDWILVCYGLFVIVVGLKNLLVKNHVILPKWATFGLLVAAGLVHGAFLSGGSLLAIYAMERFREKQVFRSTLSLVWLVINLTVLITSFVQGHIQPDELQFGLWGILPAFLGIVAGEALQEKLDAKKFMSFANYLLLLSAFILLWNCFFG